MTGETHRRRRARRYSPRIHRLREDARAGRQLKALQRLPLEACICGEHFDCPDGWHWSDEEQPCACTPDCGLERGRPGRAPTAGRKNHPPGQPPRTPKIWTGDEGDAHRAAFFREGGIRPDGKNPGNVWPMATASRPGNRYHHYAMFPRELVARVVKATVPKGGVVLDPFGGTGTTAEVANELLRRAVLVELDPASIEAITVRCQKRPIVEVPA